MFLRFIIIAYPRLASFSPSLSAKKIAKEVRRGGVDGGFEPALRRAVPGGALRPRGRPDAARNRSRSRPAGFCNGEIIQNFSEAWLSERIKKAWAKFQKVWKHWGRHFTCSECVFSVAVIYITENTFFGQRTHTVQQHAFGTKTQMICRKEKDILIEHLRPDIFRSVSTWRNPGGLLRFKVFSS